MRVIRRYEHDLRVDIMPLIDVVFLLLTFFIFSLVVMVQAEVLPVQLQPLTAGNPVSGQTLQVVTLGPDGGYFFNGESLTDTEFDRRLTAYATDPAAPTLFIALAQDGLSDRGPRLLNLFEKLDQAGITNIAFVGTPNTPTPGSTPAPGSVPTPGNTPNPAAP